MDKIQKFKRSTRQAFKRLTNSEVKNAEDLNLNFTTHIYKEQRVITWLLENCDQCPLKLGEYHESPHFNTGFSRCAEWALRFYPKGKTSSGRIGVYICQISSNSKVSVEFNLCLKFPCVEDEITVLEKKNFRMDSGEYGSDVNCSYERLLLQESVLIICRLSVGYLDEAGDVESCVAGASTLCSLSTDLKEMYSSGKFSDITLQAGKKHFPAHKAILAARSSVFAAMFDHDMEESHTNVVNIEDIEPSVLSDVLHYVYTGAIDNVTVDKAIALFPVADKYALNELKMRCVRVMLAKVCVENVCQIAILADMHSEPKLKAAAFHVFRAYKHQIFQKKEWDAVIQKNPKLASEIVNAASTDFNAKCSAACTGKT